MIGPWNKIGFRQIAFGGGDKGGSGGGREDGPTLDQVASRGPSYNDQANVNSINRNGGGGGMVARDGGSSTASDVAAKAAKAAADKAAADKAAADKAAADKAAAAKAAADKAAADKAAADKAAADKAAADKAAADKTKAAAAAEAKRLAEAKNSLFGTMMTNSSKYIEELKKGFTGAVTMGERDGPSLGGAQFTNEFRDYAKSMGYEIDKGLSPMDGPSFLVRPEGWTPDAFNAHIKTQEETAAAAAAQTAQDRAAAAAAAAAEAIRLAKVKELTDALTASQSLYGELQDKYGKTQEEYTGLKSQFEELFGSYGTLTGTYDDQKAAYDDLYGQYDTLESQLVDYNTQLADQKTNYESLMGQYSDLTGQYEDTTSLYDTLQSDFSGLQGTLAEQQAAYEAQKAAAEKNRVLGIAEKATSGAASPDPRYTQPAQTATPAYTPVAANQGAQSLTPEATPYGIAPIDYAATMPNFMNNPLDLSVPFIGATGQNAPPPIGGPMQQLTPMMDYSAPFQPYLQSINQQYGVNIPSAYTGIMAGGRQ
jgi:hypothetical protein